VSKKIVILLLFISIGYVVSGQQEPIYSQYWTNKFLLNPAVAGHEGYTSINLTARKQWAGLKDAPGTVALSGQTRILKKSFMTRTRNPRKRRRYKTRSGRVGVGGYIFNDNISVFNKLGFQGTYSYHINLNRSQLSFGASLTGMQYSIEKDRIITEVDDPKIASFSDRGYFFDSNFGVYYSDKNLYGGFSIQNLFESYIRMNNWDADTARVRLERQYMMMSGYRFPAIDFVFIEPSFNLRVAENVVSQLDINLTAYFKEDYWGGFAFRTGSSSRIATETLGGRGAGLIIYGGARIEQVHFGYSFDYTLSSIQRHTYGSHEVMVAIRFGDNARRYRWLNRY
jgi:type IX secretion system PorP/SprF family membrane protein